MNILHLVHLGFEENDKPEFEKEVLNLVEKTKFDLIFVVDEPSFLKIEDKNNAEWMIKRWNYTSINNFVEYLYIAGLVESIGIVKNDGFKNILYSEGFYIDKYDEFIDILKNKVFDDIDLDVFYTDPFKDDKIDNEILDKKKLLINKIKENINKYYTKMNNIINIENDVYGFTRFNKSKTPANKKRYNNILNKINQIYPKEKIVYTYMYNGASYISNDNENYNKIGISDYEHMEYIYFLANKKEFLKVIGKIKSELDTKYNSYLFKIKKNKVNHIFSGEYEGECVLNYSNKLYLYMKDMLTNKELKLHNFLNGPQLKSEEFILEKLS